MFLTNLHENYQHQQSQTGTGSIQLGLTSHYNQTTFIIGSTVITCKFALKRLIEDKIGTECEWYSSFGIDVRRNTNCKSEHAFLTGCFKGGFERSANNL